MRGKVVFFSITIQIIRITPAYAGKRLRFPVMMVHSLDHPRLCGEKGNHRTGKSDGVGSPPPMRGKAKTRSYGFGRSRITPAYAGKSFGDRPAVRSREDHPRLCGEKWNKEWFTESSLGSPPPMRGKVSEIVCSFSGNGITPAYAGKSTVCNQRTGFSGDHPRLCGEKGIEPDPTAAEEGSPPPMRGKDKLSGLERTLHRITPAYAGKSNLPRGCRHA